MSAVSKTANLGSIPSSPALANRPAERNSAPPGMLLHHGAEMTQRAGNDKRIGAAFAVVAALMALALALLISPPGLDANALGGGCAHADATPDQASSKQLRKALACLINRERADRNRVRVRPNADLAGIARRHTKVMVKENCFKHECPGERPLKKRIESSGYIKGGGRYGYGENLGCSRTPALMIEAWMTSSFHRKNIVDRRFRHLGIGAKNGSPYPRGANLCRPGKDYMTYTAIFAWRKPKR